MNISRVSETNDFESDLFDRDAEDKSEAEREKESWKEENEKEAENAIIFIETVKATNTNYVNCGRGNGQGHLFIYSS